ncbi:MAG: 30S ribosomal protein S15 [Thermoplasmata archaeon]|nr:30S ribosomal protein S15 [Thermoplasmata archaeon]
MARMHARRRGSSGSKKPYAKEKPSWASTDAKDIEEIITRLSNEGKTPAMIGIILRDNYSVPSVRLCTGKSLSQILSEKNLASRLPDDLQNLMKRAVSLNEHVKRNPKDNHNKRGLLLIESKIRRLVKYYGREGRLPEGWKYSLDTAKLEIE